MRQGIHPDYVETKVTCSCGNTFVTRSVKPELHVELCNKCHPFYTGKQKLVDTGGRVERFQKKYASRRPASPPAAEASIGRGEPDAGSTAETEAGTSATAETEAGASATAETS